MIGNILLASIMLFGNQDTKADSLIRQNSNVINSSVEIVKFIRSNNLNTTEQVRAITVFICDKLEYDTTVGHKKLDDPDMIIKEKKAICSEYSLLFKSLCDSLGIRSEIIMGITDKHYPHYIKTARINYVHNWNIVYIGDKQYLIDPTWCDTSWKNYSTIDEQWYLSDPKIFIKTHYPCGNAIMVLDYCMFERFKHLYSCSYLDVVNKCPEFLTECQANYKWQLLEKPITYKYFIGVK
jgi:hypothetical protein